MVPCTVSLVLRWPNPVIWYYSAWSQTVERKRKDENWYMSRNQNMYTANRGTITLRCEMSATIIQHPKVVTWFKASLARGFLLADVRQQTPWPPHLERTRRQMMSLSSNRQLLSATPKTGARWPSSRCTSKEALERTMHSSPPQNPPLRDNYRRPRVRLLVTQLHSTTQRSPRGTEATTPIKMLMCEATMFHKLLPKDRQKSRMEDLGRKLPSRVSEAPHSQTEVWGHFPSHHIWGKEKVSFQFSFSSHFHYL